MRRPPRSRPLFLDIEDLGLVNVEAIDAIRPGEQEGIVLDIRGGASHWSGVSIERMKKALRGIPT